MFFHFTRDTFNLLCLHMHDHGFGELEFPTNFSKPDLDESVVLAVAKKDGPTK